MVNCKIKLNLGHHEYEKLISIPALPTTENTKMGFKVNGIDCLVRPASFEIYEGEEYFIIYLNPFSFTENMFGKIIKEIENDISWKKIF
jgi:hypothetical protein